MSDFKAGDVVDVAFRAVVKHDKGKYGSTLTVMHIDSNISFPIWAKEATKVKPVLPTVFGSVVEARDAKWVLGQHFWISEDGASATTNAMRKEDYTVIRDGI